VHYQWQTSTDNFVSNIVNVGSDSATYRVLEGDEGAQVRVVASSTDTDGGTASTTSSATSAVTDITPALTAVTIASAAKEGDTLTASGAAANDVDAVVHYQWQTSTDNFVSNIVNVGSNSATYRVLEGDEGAQVRVVASSTDTDGGTASTTSNATSAVTDITPALTAVTIASAAKEGDTLTASGAAANDVDAVVHYQWQTSTDNFVSNIVNVGSNSATYRVLEGDEGAQVRVVASSTDT